MDAALIILDGWGLRDDDFESDSDAPSLDSAVSSEGRDAVATAETPNFDRFARTGAFGTLNVSGRRVGLPNGQMGNSEVGHINIGAGRIVMQAYTRINDAIARSRGTLGGDEGNVSDGSFLRNEAIESAFDYVDESDGGRVHFMGLLSDGGVHSDQEHLYALIEHAANRDVEAVTHAFTDGRDTDPKSGERHLSDLEEAVDDYGTGDVATVSGRYYAMDRDLNWERTKRAYDAIVNREAAHEAESGLEAVRASYERGDTDEFVQPTLVTGEPALQDGDAVIFFNFRSDRARQLCRLLTNTQPEWEFDLAPPEIRLVTMTQYDKTFDFPVAFPPHQPEDTLGEVVAAYGMTQARLAESEKYPHVTYFLNGGREIAFEGEIRRIVQSPDVPTYDETPEMSAEELTDTAISIVESDDPNLLILNYANPDMVGHTGDFDAAVAAVEAVDTQLGRLVAAVQAAGGDVVITADHGNADDMGTPERPHTAHTFNPVPVVYLTSEDDDGGRTVRTGGSLCDLAPTLLRLLGIDQPEAMTGESLLK